MSSVMQCFVKNNYIIDGTLMIHVYRICDTLYREKNQQSFEKHTFGRGGSSKFDGISDTISDTVFILAQLCDLS